MNTLKQVKVGQTCTVKRVHGEGALDAELWIWVLPRVLRFT